MTAQDVPHAPMWRKVISLPTTRLGWYSVVASDISEEGLRRTEDVEGVSVVRADVSSAEDVEGMIGAAIERHVRLDVLVNNAGIMDRFLPATEMPDEL